MLTRCLSYFSADKSHRDLSQEILKDTICDLSVCLQIFRLIPVLEMSRYMLVHHTGTSL
jgi:hypothetical protein